MMLLSDSSIEPQPVVVHQQVDKVLEEVRLVGAKRASRYLVHGLFQLRDAVVVGHSIITEDRKIFTP